MFSADDADQLTLFELPLPTDADVDSMALEDAMAVERALANAEPPAVDEPEHVTSADASVGLRLSREDSEPARKPTPLTAVVQSELGTFTAHANTAPFVLATKKTAPSSSVLLSLRPL